MISPTRKPVVFKKYRCRFFSEDGVEGFPRCNQGDNCRFVHPSDPNWPGLKPRSRSASPHAQRKSSDSKSDFNSRATDSQIKPRPGGPLVPQSDLFRLCKGESDHNDNWFLEGDDSRGLDKSRSRDSWDSHDSRGRGYDRRSREIEPRSGLSKEHPMDSARREARVLDSTGDFTFPDRIPGFDTPDTTSTTEFRERNRSQQLLQLFHNLAKLSNQTFQDNATYETAEQRIKTYTDISSTLQKISASAGAAVGPTLNEMTIKKEQAKKRAQLNYAALEDVWEQIFEIFISEVADAIDRTLETALETMKDEAERLVHRLLGNSGIGSRKSLKRPSFDASDEDTLRSEGDRKRRRLAGWSPSPSPTHKSSTATDPTMPPISDYLVQMNAHFEKQSHNLEVLTKENSELRTLLLNQAAGSSNLTEGSGQARKAPRNAPTEPRSSLPVMEVNAALELDLLALRQVKPVLLVVAPL
ncbi:hypothetical protein C8J56DRAFT_1098621 [Mycena floridula]|nr:hypothetical protein C8J56DRAFT_1098621 [Mycena floridula]